ncbi:unnamed protein product [Symbiodinium natans]|uniref:Uncharacterized protein n=1 Tax=Symbiodinium natans TaxID=878477 RepID=A0A812UIN5_9DINO|nr:unnamed protein product [Symbiodinium natans]
MFWHIFKGKFHRTPPARGKRAKTSNLAQANMLMMLNQTIQAMLREGCPRLLVDDTDFVTSVRWCDGLPDLFRPLASLCPETCGCKASFSASCPPRCQLELHNSSNASSS